MLRRLPIALAFLALGCGSAQKASPVVGDRLPELPLTQFTQSEVASLDDAFGQALLLEFFAYW